MDIRLPIILSEHRTHRDIVKQDIRNKLALELWVLRRSMRRCGQPMNSDWVQGIRLGLDTFARRMGGAI